MSQPSSPDYKACNVCLLHKAAACFSKNAARHDGLQQRCKECDRANYRERYAANPERSKERTLQAKYGIGLATYAKMYDSQGGACAICAGNLTTRKGTHVDHDHATGKVRGLLCFNCNTGLGLFKDSMTSLRAAALYLEKHK